MRTLLAIAIIMAGFVIAPLASANAARLEARVDLSQQKMRVYRNGRLIHVWPVSTGRKGYRTPTGTWRVHRMHRHYTSRKYKAKMPYAMFYYHGFAIHATNSTRRLGRPASHGCIRLAPGHARKLFNMTRKVGGRNLRVRVHR